MAHAQADVTARDKKGLTATELGRNKKVEPSLSTMLSNCRVPFCGTDDTYEVVAFEWPL